MRCPTAYGVAQCRLGRRPGAWTFKPGTNRCVHPTEIFRFPSSLSQEAPPSCSSWLATPAALSRLLSQAFPYANRPLLNLARTFGKHEQHVSHGSEDGSQFCCTTSPQTVRTNRQANCKSFWQISLAPLRLQCEGHQLARPTPFLFISVNLILQLTPSIHCC